MIVYTDGSCLGNPGPGGMGIVIIRDNIPVMEIGVPSIEITTNNRMELGAVVYIIDKLIDCGETECTIVTDSTYVVKGVNEWLDGWKKKNFKKVKNDDLWKELDALLPNIKYTFQWVRGHNKNQFNEMADRIAVEAATTQMMVTR